VSKSGISIGSHPFIAEQGPIGLAHRGGGREAPENSLSAFRNAQRLGFRYFETDVRATADGKVMVFHDGTLNRVTGRVGRISSLPYSEVRRAKIGGVDQILRLEELFEEFPDTFINIDVKDDHTVEPFLAMMKDSRHCDRVCVASFGTRSRPRSRPRRSPLLSRHLDSDRWDGYRIWHSPRRRNASKSQSHRTGSQSSPSDLLILHIAAD
jgi:glycerophosphoryl diester phosphodiesterase